MDNGVNMPQLMSFICLDLLLNLLMHYHWCFHVSYQGLFVEFYSTVLL